MLDWSEQQRAILASDAERLAVHALAGTGKTTTAEGYARARPDQRFLYLVFNKSAQEAARQRFPANVKVLTSHALAYAEFGSHFRHKLTGAIRLHEVRRALDGAVTDYTELRLIADTVTRYLHSADAKFHHDHVVRPPGWRGALDSERVIHHARRLWYAMCDVDNKAAGMTHDGYLKIYQLRGRPLAARFDRIILDEAQDTNPVTEAIVCRQELPILMIGDSNQSIYGFRGAVDALDRFAADERLPLTHSYRFGPQLAKLANALLGHYTDEPHALVGSGPATRIGPLPDDGTPYTRIHRTFAETFRSALDAAANRRRCAWVGGMDNYPLQELEDLYHLYSGQPQQIHDRRIVQDYHHYGAYKETAKATRDPEMNRMVRIVEEYGKELPQLLAAIRRTSVAVESADCVVTTAHRAKGAEWERVAIADDFTDLHDPDLEPGRRREEANLAYVAATRASHHLDLPSAEQHIWTRPPPARDTGRRRRKRAAG